MGFVVYSFCLYGDFAILDIQYLLIDVEYNGITMMLLFCIPFYQGVQNFYFERKIWNGKTKIHGRSV